MSSNVERTESLPASNIADDQPDAEFLALPPKVQRFIHLHITGQYTVQKLATLLEVHPNTCFNWLKQPTVKRFITEMQVANTEMVASHLKAMTMKAVGKLSELIDSPIDGVALQAVKDILDRAGHKAKQEIKVEKTITYEEKMKELVNMTIIEGEYTVEGE